MAPEWHWWTCTRFDGAVSALGRWVENRLNERDKDGEPIYTLEALIYPPKKPVVTRNSEQES